MIGVGQQAILWLQARILGRRHLQVGSGSLGVQQHQVPRRGARDRPDGGDGVVDPLVGERDP